MTEPVATDIPSYGKRLPFRRPDGSIGETVQAGNLMCPDQIASNPKYRDNYDQINWESKPKEPKRKES